MVNEKVLSGTQNSRLEDRKIMIAIANQCPNLSLSMQSRVMLKIDSRRLQPRLLGFFLLFVNFDGVWSERLSGMGFESPQYGFQYKSDHFSFFNNFRDSQQAPYHKSGRWFSKGFRVGSRGPEVDVLSEPYSLHVDNRLFFSGYKDESTQISQLL